MGKFGFSFSWKRLLGLTGMKQRMARQIGVPLTKGGFERKIGATIINFILRLISGKR